MNRLKRMKALLIDLNGTIHIEDTSTPNAIKAVTLLKQAEVPFLFVSNTSKESRQGILNRLYRVGFDKKTIVLDQIFTSLTAAKNYVEQNDVKLFPLVSDSSLSEIPTELVHKEKDFTQKSVLVGLAPDSFTFENMNYSFRLLTNHGAELIAMNKGRYHKTSSGLSLGPGPFVEALEFASGTKATVIGKPSLSFFNQASKILGVQLANCVMVGDDARDDVCGALEAGVGFGVLVRSGKFLHGDESFLKNFDDYSYCVADNFAEFVNLYLSQIE